MRYSNEDLKLFNKLRNSKYYDLLVKLIENLEDDVKDYLLYCDLKDVEPSRIKAKAYNEILTSINHYAEMYCKEKEEENYD